MKNELIKTLSQNLHHGKEYCISKKKKLLMQCLKEVIYQYILAFGGWWSIFWEMVSSRGYIWLLVGGGGHILAGGGWWWMVVNGGGGW